MSPESISQLARQNKAERPEKSQEDLRNTLEKHLFSLKPTIEEEARKYKEALESDVFEDKEGELEGSGEKRKEEMQNRINSIIDRASAIKEKLDSKEPLPQSTPEISATYTRPDKKKETITLDIEAKLEEFTDFYNKTKLDLPPDFEESIKDIWEKNQIEIQEAIEQNGFDDLLVVPGNISLTEIKDKMSMKNGYYESNNFKEGGSFKGAQSSNTDKSRIILVHKVQELTDRPELASTLNIKGQDVKLDQTLTLEDYIIFQRKYFEETGKHLDEKKYTWLATKSGSRLVNSYWNPDDDYLAVYANDLENQDDSLGVRPSRSFF